MTQKDDDEIKALYDQIPWVSTPSDPRNDRGETLTECVKRMVHDYRGVNEAIRRATACCLYYERYASHSEAANKQLAFWRTVVKLVEIDYEVRTRLNTPDQKA